MLTWGHARQIDVDHAIGVGGVGVANLNGTPRGGVKQFDHLILSHIPHQRECVAAGDVVEIAFAGVMGCDQVQQVHAHNHRVIGSGSSGATFRKRRSGAGVVAQWCEQTRTGLSQNGVAIVTETVHRGHTHRCGATQDRGTGFQQSQFTGFQVIQKCVGCFGVGIREHHAVVAQLGGIGHREGQVTPIGAENLARGEGERPAGCLHATCSGTVVDQSCLPCGQVVGKIIQNLCAIAVDEGRTVVSKIAGHGTRKHHIAPIGRNAHQRRVVAGSAALATRHATMGDQLECTCGDVVGHQVVDTFCRIAEAHTVVAQSADIGCRKHQVLAVAAEVLHSG